jgi:hypothetical protein
MGFGTATNSSFTNSLGTAVNLFSGGFSGVGAAAAGFNANSYGNGGSSFDDANGGGGGGGCIAFITGLTPGAGITVTVGAAGARATASAGNGYAGFVVVEW